MNKEEIKNNQIPEEIKDICRSCESNIFAQNKGCAFRSLGNEYCDYVLNATKLYLEKDKQFDKYKNVIDKIKECIEEVNDDEFYINLTKKEKVLLKILEMLEEL